MTRAGCTWSTLSVTVLQLPNFYPNYQVLWLTRQGNDDADLARWLMLAATRSYIRFAKHSLDLCTSFFRMLVSLPRFASHWTASSSAEWSLESQTKPSYSFVEKHESTMWDIVWISPQEHRFVRSFYRRHSGPGKCGNRQRPLLSSKVKARLLDCWVGH